MTVVVDQDCHEIGAIMESLQSLGMKKPRADSVNRQVGSCFFSASNDVEVEPIKMYGDADRHPRSSIF